MLDGRGKGLGGEMESVVERARALSARAAVEVAAGEGDGSAESQDGSGSVLVEAGPLLAGRAVDGIGLVRFVFF